MTELRVTMSARAVVARGQPFAPRGVPFADAGVAFDEISSLRPHAEPMVLRVTATGGKATERGSVAGDWLCEADGSAPRRVSRPLWGYNTISEAWSRVLTWLDAWERCEDASWMLHAAVRARVDHRLVAAGVCACARTALYLAPEGEMRPALAVLAADRWAHGDGPAQAMVATAEAVARAPGGAAHVAVITAAFASGRGLLGAHHVPTDAAYAAASVAELGATYRSLRERSVFPPSSTSDLTATALREMADLVRENVPTIAVLRAVTGA